MHLQWEFATSHQKDADTFKPWSVYTSDLFHHEEERKQTETWGGQDLSQSGSKSNLSAEWIVNVPEHSECWWQLSLFLCFHQVQIVETHNRSCTHSPCWVWGNARWASKCFWQLSCSETPGRSRTVCARGVGRVWPESWRPDLEHKETISQRNTRAADESGRPWERRCEPVSLSSTAMALFLGRPRGSRRLIIVGTSSSECWDSSSTVSSTYRVKEHFLIKKKKLKTCINPISL